MASYAIIKVVEAAFRMPTALQPYLTFADMVEVAHGGPFVVNNSVDEITQALILRADNERAKAKRLDDELNYWKGKSGFWGGEG